MAKVIAKEKGYFGGVIREKGDVFVVPDEIWNNPNLRPSWCAPAAFGGKGDHDGDGKVGGSLPKKPKPVKEPEPKEPAVEVPADWQSLPAKDRKALAEQITGEKVPNAKEADAVISAYVEATKPEVFGDAPAPQTITEAKKNIGDVAPDWVAPQPVDE